MQPGTSVSPIAMRCWDGDAEQLGGFFKGGSDKVTQLDQLRLARIVGRQAIERFMDREQFFVVAGRKGDLNLRHVEVLGATTSLLALFATGALDHDAPHGFSRGAEKMSAI